MNGNNPYISVVIISYNGLEFIDDCLSSVKKSLEGVAAEIIVVDNGSSDGTAILIKTKYPEIKLIANDTNLGFAMAANQGIKTVVGKYILLLNQDIRIREKAISLLAERLEQEEHIGVIGPKFIGFDGRLQKGCRSFPRYGTLFFEFSGLSRLFPHSRLFSEWRMGWFNHLEESQVDQPMGAAMMFRKTLLEKIGFFDEGFGIFFNDVDFCRRAKEAGCKNLYFPEAVVEHYVGGSTRKMKARMIYKSHGSMYRYFRKYNRAVLSLPLLYFWGVLLFLSALLRIGHYKLFRR
ncbi:MAG: glycosyltransferase family 2 protein [candidate division Zixibacteria bacterium]|nr:glycosyltransferase family 2 protein [candidate division Zixibacteria bacterium]